MTLYPRPVARLQPGSAAAIAVFVALVCHAEPAAAQTPVVIDGVPSDMRSAIAGALPARDKPQSLFDAERLSEEAAERATKWLRSEGYYGGEAIPEPSDAPPVARIRITPGPQYVLEAPELAFSGESPAKDAQDAARGELGALAPGAPARAVDVLRVEANVVAALKAHGHPDAKAGERRVVVDHLKKSMAAKLSVETGARTRLGDVRVSPPELLRKSFIARSTTWKRGEDYAPDKLATLRRDLASTGAFSVVSAALADDANTDGTRDVVITLERAKPRVLELGAGWSTTDGAGLEAKWTRRNVTRRADSLAFEMTLAEQRQSFGVTLDEPNAAGPGQSLRLTGDISHDTTEAFQRTGVSASAAVDAARRLQFAVTYGVSASADFYSRAEGVENAVVLSAFADVRRDTTGSPLDARSGYLVQARLEPGLSTGDATVPYARVTAQARAYATPERMGNITLAARTRVGWIEPVGGTASALPLDRLFYAGGGGSVRGYDFNSIFPAQNLALDKPPGGRGLLEISGEARARVTGKLGAVAFVDGGAAFNEFEDAARLRFGAGVGVRYDLGFAPLRFDVATPISPRAQDARVAFYVSIGQAF